MFGFVVFRPTVTGRRRARRNPLGVILGATGDRMDHYWRKSIVTPRRPGSGAESAFRDAKQFPLDAARRAHAAHQSCMLTDASTPNGAKVEQS